MYVSRRRSIVIAKYIFGIKVGQVTMNIVIAYGRGLN